MSPCSPSPPRPALAASATVARFRVSTEMGGLFLFLTRGPQGPFLVDQMWGMPGKNPWWASQH